MLRGYKDDAFTVTETKWAAKEDGSYERTVTKVCDYCGYTETVKEVKKDDIVDIIPVILPAISKNETAPKLNTRDHFAYVQGYPDGTVKPAGSITRAEVAAILFRLMDADSRSLYYSTASGFRDVDSTKWYNTYVATLNNAGVITDSRTGYFRPNDAITRAELAAMLAQFAEKKSAAIYFSDISAGYWAANAIALTANLGWINGYPDGTFGPDKTVTRAELMAMVNRATGRAPESTSALLSGMKTWKDNADTARWYYLDVQEATNSHTYLGAPTETWTSLTATPRLVSVRISAPNKKEPSPGWFLFASVNAEVLPHAPPKSLPFQGRWLGEAETERLLQICGDLSVSLAADSSP